MGSSARMSRSERFIQEFNIDACLRNDYGDLPSFKSQHLSQRDGDEMVYLYVLLSWREREYEVMEDCIYYDPEEPDNDTIERVCDLLGLEEDEAKKRLKKAGLIE